MDKTNIRLQELFQDYAGGSLSDIDKEELWGYILDPVHEHEVKALISADYRRDHRIPGLTDAESAAMLNHVFAAGAPGLKVDKRIGIWPRIAVAAAVVLMVFSAGLFYYSNQHPKTDNQFAVVGNDVAPGKNGATIAIGNGKVIQLSDAKKGVVVGKDLTYDDQSAVLTGNGGDEGDPALDAKTIMQVNASTGRGQTYQFTLPDGTKVWLNADSKISFPSQFNGKERKILLSGEGYFEVAKDKAHPFIVQTDKQKVEVLGTHFNINAYTDEKAIATTLLEGSVKISSDDQAGKVLKPGQQAVNTGTSIVVKEVDTENIMDWKDGDFNLDQVDFRVAMRKIARWYNVEVVYDENFPGDLQISGWISRTKNLSSILKFIETSGNAHFKLEGRTVYVYK